MTACTQPRCIGTIVDGYCDVCGSPAVAAPFVPAAARISTDCTQPVCTGIIVDGYCDVCGSPAGAVPFISTAAAASAASSTSAGEPGLTAVPASTPASARADQEIPAQRIPRVKVPRQQSFPQEMTDPGAAAPGAVDAAQKADGEKERAQDEPDRAQDYRRRVEDAQLPDEVRKAALSEVDELERTSDQNPESGDIRTWLETILDLPWSTNTTDWIDIQGSPEVEATLRRLIEPAVADVEEGNTAEAGRVAADVEEGNTASPAGPEHDDTAKMPAVRAVLGGGQHQHAHFPEQPVLGPEPVQTPAKKRRFGSLARVALALVALLIGALLFAASRDRDVTAQSIPTVTATATATVTKPTNAPSNQSTDTGGEESTIQLEDLPESARPFETVRIKGTYRGGAETFLRVQRWEDGKWLAFPVPTKTDQSGKFTAYVEFGQPGRYQLRVLHLGSGVTSKAFVLVIQG
jgi:hypothetical protein